MGPPNEHPNLEGTRLEIATDRRAAVDAHAAFEAVFVNRLFGALLKEAAMTGG